MVIFQKRVADLSELALDRFIARARRAAGVKGLVNVLLTSSTEMKTLNRRFRGKEKATDVLSFPAEFDRHKHLAGEIAISADIATRNAQVFGHSPANEVKILVLHGVLHLRGYDHESDAEAETMETLEAEILAQLGIPNPYADRDAGGNRERID